MGKVSLGRPTFRGGEAVEQSSRLEGTHKKGGVTEKDPRAFRLRGPSCCPDPALYLAKILTNEEHVFVGEKKYKIYSIL